MVNFFQRVYKVVSRIPRGKVMTYGGIARVLGTGDARRIGHALHANKDGDRVPCHRVVAKDGRLAPAYVFGGPNEQRKKLKSEGVPFVDEMHVDLEKCIINLV